MVDESFFSSYNLNITDEEARRYIELLTDDYNKRKQNNNLYCNYNNIPENIITIYMYYIVKNDFKLIVEAYKRKFVLNESVVEPGITKEERIGLGYVYDYLKDFDFEKEKFNIFITSLKIHSKLYCACPHPEFGGKLRTDTAVLKEANVDVLTPEEASKQFQSYISKDIDISKLGIFGYIDECIKTTIDLIRIQPFSDGNKRTFRALLNIMLSKIMIPPIYIRKAEREEYKKQLLNALCNYDYEGITRFYYYKICDAIVNLDLEHEKNNLIRSKEEKESNDKKRTRV